MNTGIAKRVTRWAPQYRGRVIKERFRIVESEPEYSRVYYISPENYMNQSTTSDTAVWYTMGS